MSRTVLISGASIAGPALAYWLKSYGFQVTVVERAPELRAGGQNVDVRGAGREVVRRMGIEDDIFAATTGEAGVRFVDAADQTVAAFPAGTSDSDGPTAELESLRGTWRGSSSSGPRARWASLALTGAYVLAGELARNTDHEEAFAAYEAIMRPYVRQAQQLPPGTPRLANPRTSWASRRSTLC